MKTIIRDVAVLDAREATRETIDAIESIRDVALLLLSKRTAPWFAAVRCDDVAAMCVLPDDAQMMMSNGSCLLCSDEAAGKRYLLINGTVTVDAGLTSDKIREQIAGGMINGSIFCSASQMGALGGVGVKVNGSMETYPDGWQLRVGETPLRAAEAAALAPGARVYLAKRVLIERGAAQALAAAGVRLQARKGVLCYASDAQALGQIYESDLSGCAFIPDGYTVHDGDLDVGARTAFKLRASLYLTGHLTVREDVDADKLARLERLHVDGRAIVPLSLMEALLEKTEGETDWMPYEGALLVNEGKLELTPEMLDGLADRFAIANDGMLVIDPAVEAKALKERVTLLQNDGMCCMTQAQRGALAQVLGGDGAYRDPDQEKEGQPDEADLGGDVRVIADVASLTL